MFGYRLIVLWFSGCVSGWCALVFVCSILITFVYFNSVVIVFIFEYMLRSWLVVWIRMFVLFVGCIGYFVWCCDLFNLVGFACNRLLIRVFLLLVCFGVYWFDYVVWEFLGGMVCDGFWVACLLVVCRFGWLLRCGWLLIVLLV